MVYTITESLLNEIIDVLESAKHEHFWDDYLCDGCSYIHHGGTCDCGAKEVNEKIDALIEKLVKDFDMSNFILCAK